MKAVLLAIAVLTGCANPPGLELTASQAAVCREVKCHVLTSAQLEAALTDLLLQAALPLFEAGMEEGAKSCKRIKI